MSPRELTNDEVREAFLHQVRVYVRYWSNQTDQTVEERMSGLAFSLLVILDGGSALPAFQVIPYPATEDKQYAIENGSNWYPQSEPNDHDIAGGLHELLYRQ